MYENAKAVIEDNEVFGNKLAGIAVRSGAEPMIRRNKIYGGHDVGVLFYESARGTLLQNDIHSNGKTNVDVRTGSVVELQDNTIHKSKLYVCLLARRGGGQLATQLNAQKEFGCLSIVLQFTTNIYLCRHLLRESAD